MTIIFLSTVFGCITIGQGGNKPVVVLAHGITDNGLCWTSLAKALEADFDLIMVDARGHGLSDKPEDGYSASDHAEDLFGLIKALKLEKPYIIGHSMGGVVAAVLADKYPDDVGRLVLEDPAWYPRDDDVTEEEVIEHVTEWAKAIVERKSQSIEDIEAKIRQDNPDWNPSEYAPLAQGKSQVSPHVTKFLLASDKPWWEILPSLQCPTLILSGDKENEVALSPDIAGEVESLNPAIKITRLAGAGHNVRRDCFAEYLKQMREFMSA